MSSRREEELFGLLARVIARGVIEGHTEEDNGYGDKDHENMVIAEERYYPWTEG